MIDASNDIKQYFPAGLDGAAKHLKRVFVGFVDIFPNNTFLNK
jgi:hypothetical protein